MKEYDKSLIEVWKWKEKVYCDVVSNSLRGTKYSTVVPT